MQNETIKSILEKAANKENGTYLLYKNLEVRVEDTRTRAILKKLAAEKLRHKQVIENFNTELLNKKQIKNISRYGISEYFTEESFEEGSGFKDAFIYAAKREKRAYEFYHNMSKIVEHSDLKRLFKWLSREESKQKKDIEVLLRKVV
jgi:rubrerythrin